MSAVTACVSDRIHSSSSNMLCWSVFFFHQDIICVGGRKRLSSGISPVVHLTVWMLRTLESRLRCPAPAKAMIASRCSCRSPKGPGALMCASLTWGAMLFLSCCALTLSQHHLPKPQAARAACARSVPVGVYLGRLSVFCRAPFMALQMDPMEWPSLNLNEVRQAAVRHVQ